MLVKAGIHPLYVLEEMSELEINAVLKQMDKDIKEDYNKLRMICYYSVAPHFTEKPAPTIEKFMPFPWDKENKKVVNSELSKEDLSNINKELNDFCNAWNIKQD